MRTIYCSFIVVTQIQIKYKTVNEKIVRKNKNFVFVEIFIYVKKYNNVPGNLYLSTRYDVT